MDDDKPLFQGIDEYERTYAPQELPEDDPERGRVRAEGEDMDESAGGLVEEEPPSAAPVASPATSPSSVAAPPNIGHEDRGGGPGDPDTQARNPITNQ